jgi:hypothetical protein
MQSVHEVLNHREGGLLVGYLKDHGVDAEMVGGAFSSVRGELANIRGVLPLIYVVNDEDADRAKALIQEYEAKLRQAPEGEPWVCPACGEALEPQFESCWKCQAERP